MLVLEIDATQEIGTSHKTRGSPSPSSGSSMDSMYSTATRASCQREHNTAPRNSERGLSACVESSLSPQGRPAALTSAIPAEKTSRANKQGHALFVSSATISLPSFLHVSARNQTSEIHDTAATPLRYITAATPHLQRGKTTACAGQLRCGAHRCPDPSRPAAVSRGSPVA